jgi:aspartyl-tRNA(Asn)/glutamyl-tRNA(Gln) amidotransferase subunit C
MNLSTEQVKKVAKLANLPVTEQEEELYAEQLSAILDYIDLLNSVVTSSVEPTFNVIPEKNIMRSDVAGDSLSQEDAIKNAPNKKDGYFVTKGVFAEE